MKAAPLLVCALIPAACGLVLVPATARAVQPPGIDGFVNDAFWPARARMWSLYDPSHPEDYARCYVGYDEKWLYFAADVADGNVLGNNHTPKSKAFDDDAIRLLLHFGDDSATSWTAGTLSFTFSAMGGCTWTRGPLPEAVPADAEPDWPPTTDSGVVWAVSLKPGTVPNASGPRDRGYAIEARIPWSELGIHPPFKPGTTAKVCIVNLNRPEMTLPGGRPLSTCASQRELTPRNPSTWPTLQLDWNTALAVRGLVWPLPLHMGSADPAAQAYRTAETDPHGAWLDRDRWSRKLRRMRGLNLNTLVLRHSDPLRGLLGPDTRLVASAPAPFGQPGWFADSHSKHREQFAWILDEAERNDIRIYLLCDKSEVYDPPTPTSQPADAPQPDPQEKRRRVERAIHRLFVAYPKLAGIAAGDGYDSPAMLEAITAGAKLAAEGTPLTQPAPASMEPSPPRIAPEVLVWTQDVPPKLVRGLVDSYAGVRLLCPLQKRQWYKPVIDARTIDFVADVEQCGQTAPVNPVRGIVLGSLRGPLNHLFWADPAWARMLTAQIRNQDMDGFLLEVSDGSHGGLAREMIATYAFSAGQDYSPQRWEARLRALGVGDYAGQLLEAMQHGSAIMPEALMLLHDDSDRYMPQFGMLLVEYLEKSAYRAAAGDSLGERGRLMPELPVGWTNPLWDRDVTSIGQAAARTAPPDGVRVQEIIVRIGQHVDACKGILSSLRHLELEDADQARRLSGILDAIELNALIGDHMRHKMQAALAWARYKERRSRLPNVLGPLKESVDVWEEVVKVADRLYNSPVVYWQAQPVSAPPWTPRQVEASRVPVRGGWRDQLRAFQREYHLIEQATSIDGSRGHLPLWDQVHAAPNEKCQTRFVIDFEKPDNRYRLGEGASTTNEADWRLIGKTSLLVDTRSMPNKWHEVFTTDPGLVPLGSGVKYQVLVAYRIIDPGQTDDNVAEPFEIGIRPLNTYAPLGDHRCWTGPAGYTSVRAVQVPPPAQDGNVLYIATRRPAAIVIDQIQIARIID